MNDEQIWAEIPEFPNYEVSNYGLIFNLKTKETMSVSATNHGHLKVSLVNETGRHTRSVALLVASAFVAVPNPLCDQVILLDGDLRNVAADNLAWRPNWFSWRYTRQLREQGPRYYYTLPVLNVRTNVLYDSIYHAGIEDGLLFDDIWRSTYTGDSVYPTQGVFQVHERV